MDTTTIVFLVGLVTTIALLGVGAYIKWRQRPKEGEVKAQFIIATGCLTVATLTIISLLVTILAGLTKIWYYLHKSSF